MAQTHIEAQAEFFANIPILDRKYISSVHLEDEEDELFWDTLLQEYRKGHYYYIYHSKNDSGNETSGCTQCLKYKDLLSKNFFICIDSDLRFLRGESDINPSNYIHQTYTYSWENHYCFAARLQETLGKKCPKAATKFDFNIFLSNYSSALYEPFLLFLSMDRKNIKGFTSKKFNQCLPQQCKSTDLANNGINLINNVNAAFTQFDPLKASSGFDLTDEISYYNQLGLTESNVYLHIRGHHLYHLVKHIGQQLCSGDKINFEDDILLDAVSFTEYWEIEKISSDLQLF